jgi:hypothetical protein
MNRANSDHEQRITALVAAFGILNTGVAGLTVLRVATTPPGPLLPIRLAVLGASAGGAALAAGVLVARKCRRDVNDHVSNMMCPGHDRN